MQAWVVAMAVVLGVGLVLTVYGALHDRTLNRRRATEMLGPPKRTIPHLPADAPPPAYVTEAQARRRPEGAAHREEPGGPEDAEGTTEVAVGYAAEDFVTDPATRSVTLDQPLVLVCDDAVETVRELLPTLEHVIRAARPLVLVAPAIDREVLGTLEVNAIQGKVPGVAIIADADQRSTIIELSGATALDRTDRRSGWTDPAAFGRLARWTSTRTTSRLVPARRQGAAR